jgi:ribosomal protein S18 acetylase RimI-like enzyme
MMIKKEHRNKGLGKILFKEMLEWAGHNPLIEKVSLGVFSTNHRAIALYKSMGFVKKAVRLENSS